MPFSVVISGRTVNPRAGQIPVAAHLPSGLGDWRISSAVLVQVNGPGLRFHFGRAGESHSIRIIYICRTFRDGGGPWLIDWQSRSM